jgi:hypothetical protein
MAGIGGRPARFDGNWMIAGIPAKVVHRRRKVCLHFD